MKKQISVFLAAVMLLLSLGGFAFAFDEPETGVKIIYHTGVGTPESYVCVSRGDTLEVESEPENGYLTREGYAFAGWTKSENGKVVDYCGGEELKSGVYELYALWCPTALESDEVFRFSNTKRYFTTDERDTYLLPKEKAVMLQKNIYKTFGVTPVPGVALSIALSTYPNWKWKGSCYGISTVTALQHYGLIDVRGLQSAENLSDMMADDELIGLINYYQANAATSWLCENKAFKSGTAVYASSMKKMFESVKSGNIVLYTFYTGDAFVTSGHTVLFTGAYEDSKGNHYLVTYDCNRPYRYTSGSKTDRFVLSPNFKNMKDNKGNSVGAVNWTDSFAQFDSFEIEGSGKISSWYGAFLSGIKKTVSILFSAVKI